jgi:hypothetical protein
MRLWRWLKLWWAHQRQLDREALERNPEVWREWMLP